MPTIQRLTEEVFSRIAAGEVVERPASLLKELIENSLDAGAARIDIDVTGAGKETLRVSDDGCGMDAEDVKLCLERHATSKIAAFEDLDKIRTFGFRGEALYA
ncbi:MAG: ATP-binding protein, partial [Elusimicrobia bacterium]|nr:ATP-binding protein [Elusimicrobiota bacterium]